MAVRIRQSEEQPAPEKTLTAILAPVRADENQEMQKHFPNPFPSRSPHRPAMAVWAMDAPLLARRFHHKYAFS